MTAHIISNSSVWDMAWYIISFNAALSTNMSSVWDIIWRAFSIADSTMESPIRDWTRKVIHVSLISHIPSVRDRVWRAAPMAASTATAIRCGRGPVRYLLPDILTSSNRSIRARAYWSPSWQLYLPTSPKKVIGKAWRTAPHCSFLSSSVKVRPVGAPAHIAISTANQYPVIDGDRRALLHRSFNCQYLLTKR